MKRRLPTQHTQQKLRFSFLVMLAVSALVFATFGNTKSALADSKPGGNISDPVVRAVDVAKPAVVRIITTLTSHVTVHFASGDVKFPQGGDGYIAQLSGSGTFITSNGDVLTADHVVNPPKDDSLVQYINKQAANDVAAYLTQKGKATTASDAEQQLDSGALRSDASIDQTQSEVFLSTDYTGNLTASNFNSVPSYIHASVDKIEQQSSLDQRDLAIVHANFQDTPSVQLGNSSSVQQQDELTIIGFPGNGDVSNRPTDLLTSSVNKISVSSIKTTDSGAPVIQVGGNVEHGDSGGPALDNNGRVVGVVSFGLSSPNSPGSTTFLQASSGAADMAQSLGLNTAPGPFQKLWQQSFDAYASQDAGHWHKAQTLFDQLQSTYPNFKSVEQYASYAHTQANSESQTGSTPSKSGNQLINTSSISWGLILAVIAILAIVALLFFTISARSRNKRQVAVAGYPGNPGQPVYPSQPGAFANSHPGATPGPFPPTSGAFNTPSGYDDGMAAFGAPARPSSSHPASSPMPPQPSFGGQPSPFMAQPGPTPLATPYPNNPPVTTQIWPCGHANRPEARFCSICGESAPQPPIVRRPVEQ
ncbi:hypothetical protein KSC_080180 [Ktedonobacter sp. SOSP1-52]|uniref:trypsin-like peptidase domain-containing protein n=1 Tax=Ktedonobacter sp. SOSP1-52 TaxID=2778366 RepID=UPI0019152721|nr:trypsin-like peptidase domain-containing protein [Ktedonobacter sp. SOSP1-52]GHO69126.1 hypothetical protein KSC_080180 [Ktedonobacter sp. SOSP1-52]